MTDTPLNFTPESFIKHHKDKGTLRRQWQKIGESCHHNGWDYIIVSRRHSANSGEQEEILNVNGYGVLCHLEANSADGSGQADFLLAWGEVSQRYEVNTMEELRHAAIKSLQTGNKNDG